VAGNKLRFGLPRSAFIDRQLRTRRRVAKEGVKDIITASISAIAVIFAAKAEKNSRPVSNGFTEHVIDELQALRQMLFDHVSDHKSQE
jgi:hypothetical protein